MEIVLLSELVKIDVWAEAKPGQWAVMYFCLRYFYLILTLFWQYRIFCLFPTHIFSYNFYNIYQQTTKERYSIKLLVVNAIFSKFSVIYIMVVGFFDEGNQRETTTFLQVIDNLLLYNVITNMLLNAQS